jgi:hypothetical protein
MSFKNNTFAQFSDIAEEEIETIHSSHYIAPTDEIVTSIQDYNDRDDYIGYRIITNKQEMNFLISDIQFCCEDYGAKISSDDGITEEDNIKEKIVNEKLISVMWADPSTKSKVNKFADCLSAVITITTENFKFNIILYNEHNGYYEHTYKVNWGNYSDSDEL